MPSIVPGFEYDIFISYRQNDNRSGWVTAFVADLEEELASTIKEPVSVYFDSNPKHGLGETHNVDKSLEGKLKCLILIPIISQTYCDTKSFAWQHEYCAFNKLAREDRFGRDIRLPGGNVASRILPVKIHELDKEDTALLEREQGGVLRAVEFIHKEAGVNRPLTSQDDTIRIAGKILYRDQVNKVANAIKEIIAGIKSGKERNAASPASGIPTPLKSNKRIAAFGSLIVILLALGGYFLYPRFMSTADQGSSLDKSIAVLPFENMSGDADQEYFSDGISEEILNALAQIEGLKVTGRTSSFQFKGKEVDLKEVGEKLGVATILEGSIRKQDDLLRITVQLVSAKDGYHLWSQRFDRKVTDIFAVQDEIALAVSSKLKLTLLKAGAASAPAVRGTSREAFDLYLQGRFQLNKRGKGLLNGLELFKKAVAIDSSFALACEGLATTYSLLGFYDMIRSLAAIEETKKWALKAIEIEPNSPEAYSALAFSAQLLENDWDQAHSHIQKSLEINPNNALALSVLTNFLFYARGDVPEAGRQAKLVAQIDPLFFLPYSNLGNICMKRGLYDSAVYWYNKSIELNNNSSLPFTSLANALVTQGRPNEAISLLEKAMSVTGRTPAMLNALCGAYSEAGNSEQALTIHNELREMAKTKYVAPYTLGTTVLMTGNVDAAFRYFEQALEQKNPGFYLWKHYPFESYEYWRMAMKDPRYKKIMDRLAFPE